MRTSYTNRFALNFQYNSLGEDMKDYIQKKWFEKELPGITNLLYTNGNDFGGKGVHYGMNSTYPNSKKVEVSIRSDNKGGITIKPSHPGQVKKVKDQIAFDKGVKEVKELLKDRAERLKLFNFLGDLKGRYPNKGMEWSIIQKYLSRIPCEE